MLFFKDQKAEYKKFQAAFQKEMDHCFVENGVGEGPLKVTKIDYEYTMPEFDKKRFKKYGADFRLCLHTNYDDELDDFHRFRAMGTRNVLVNGQYIEEKELVVTIFEELKSKVQCFAYDCIKKSKYKHKKRIGCNIRFFLDRINFEIDARHGIFRDYL